jgi:hypothetical protein
MTLKKLLLVVAAFCVSLAITSTARAQQFDLGFGVGTVVAPSGSSADASHTPQTLSGGAYPSFGADFLFWKKILGVGGEVSWRANQTTNLFFQPYRPIFYDFNFVAAPPLGKRAQADLQAGVGGLDIRFYQPFTTCNFFGCTNFSSSQHFSTHFGAGIRLYVWHSVFLEPQANFYYIKNNFEFSSNHAQRYSVILGYSLRNKL